MSGEHQNPEDLLRVAERERDEARERARSAEERLLGSRAIVGVLEPKLRTVERERDEAREDFTDAQRGRIANHKRARKAEADLTRLREGVERLVDEWDATARWFAGVGDIHEVKAVGTYAEDLRALLYRDGTPNGGEHCAPPGGPFNTCYRRPDGSCDSCGYTPRGR